MHQFRGLITRARVRRVQPVAPLSLVSAALALGGGDDLDLALTVAGETPVRRTISYATAEALRRGGCDAVNALPRMSFAVTRDPHATLVALRCAYETGDRPRAAFMTSQRIRIRLQQADPLVEGGIAQLNVGQRDRGMLLLRQALLLQPDHGKAAAALARELAEKGEREEAKRLLRRTYRMAMSMPESAAELRGAARDLGVELPALPPELLPPSE
jgi:Flp pilus assembly protein TadD